jgi:hypothetical protein
MHYDEHLNMGAHSREVVMHYATILKVEGSGPDEANTFFQFT